jgi:hypothetical protein
MCEDATSTLHRLLARSSEISDRLVDVLAVAIVMCQLAQVIVQLVGEQGLQRLSGALMYELAALNQQ